MSELNVKLCCLACTFKGLGIKGSFISFMWRNGHQVEHIREGTRFWSLLLQHNINPESCKKLKRCGQALIRAHHHNKAPLVHPYYWQREEIQLRYQFNDITVNMENVKRGTVLQIFQKDYNCVIGNQVLQNIVSDFMECIKQEGQAQHLPGYRFENYVSLCYKTGEIEVGTHVKEKASITVTQRAYWKDLSHAEELHEFETVLNSVDRLSLIIFKNVISARKMLTTTKPWNMFLKQCKRRLDNVLVVFSFKYVDFLQHNITSKRAARRLINSDRDPEFGKRIVWLDVSSEDDRIDSTEAGKIINWKLRNFVNGWS